MNYREAPTQAAEFNTRHRKQTGGSGQYAHIVGRLDVLPEDAEETFLFEEHVVGGRIPKQYIPAVEKGFRSMLAKGPIAELSGGRPGASIWKTARTTRSTARTWRSRSAPDGHARDVSRRRSPVLLEPVMKIEIECPSQFQGSVVGNLTSRRGMVLATEAIGADDPDRGRSAAGRDVRLLDRSAQHDAGAGHLHAGVRPLQAPAAQPRRRGDRRAEEGGAGRGGLKSCGFEGYASA